MRAGGRGKTRRCPMKDEEGKKQLIRLNIVMSYPVKWNEYKIIENFVQNFYDATGPRDFGRRFRYNVEGTTLTMTSDTGFDEKWLQYMGTSPKREGGKSYAGRFGEGFKVAALTSVRDYHLGVDMESRDWTLHVTSMSGVIDGREVSFLAYELGKRPYREESVLRLSGITKTFVEPRGRFSGTTLIYLLGLLLTAFAGTGLMMKSSRRKNAAYYRGIILQHSMK